MNFLYQVHTFERYQLFGSGIPGKTARTRHLETYNMPCCWQKGKMCNAYNFTNPFYVAKTKIQDQ